MLGLCMTRTQKLEMVAALREAGLNEKADELSKEVLMDAGIDVDKISNKLGQAKADLDNAMNNLADKLGIPRPPKRR